MAPVRVFKGPKGMTITVEGLGIPRNPRLFRRYCQKYLKAPIGILIMVLATWEFHFVVP